MDAILLPQTFQVSASTMDDVVQNPSTLIILRSIVPIHNSCHQLLSSRLTYSPLSLFLTQQSVLSRPSRTTFAREARKEFYSLFEMSMTAPVVKHTRRRPWRAFKRESRQTKGQPSPWLFGNFMEEGRSRPGLGHEVAIEASSEPIQLTPPMSPNGEEQPAAFKGIVVQKSVTVSVRDKDMDDTSKSGFSNSSTYDFENFVPLNDEAVWADICFKGIIKGH